MSPPLVPFVLLVISVSKFESVVFFVDVTWVLCELELLIEKVKVSTTPDGKVMDLFFIIDTRFSIELYLSAMCNLCISQGLNSF